MKTKTADIIEDAIITSGIGVSLVDIQSILSIVLLCFNILWLVAKLIIKVVKYYKNDGVIDEAESEDIQDDINNIINKRK